MRPRQGAWAFNSSEYVFELKWDGIRALASRDRGVLRVTDRSGGDLLPLLPELAQLPIPDGAVLGKLPAIDAVNAFSDDNRLAVIGPVVSVAQIRVLDWRTGNEVWHNGNAGWTMRVAVNPGTKAEAPKDPWPRSPAGACGSCRPTRTATTPTRAGRPSAGSRVPAEAPGPRSAGPTRPGRP